MASEKKLESIAWVIEEFRLASLQTEQRTRKSPETPWDTWDLILANEQNLLSQQKYWLLDRADEMGCSEEDLEYLISEMDEIYPVD